MREYLGPPSTLFYHGMGPLSQSARKLVDLVTTVRTNDKGIIVLGEYHPYWIHSKSNLDWLKPYVMQDEYTRPMNLASQS